MDKTLYELTAHEIRDAVRAGRVTAAHVTESFLTRIESVEPNVKAYVDVWGEYALNRARKIDARSKDGEDV